ncbi:MAG: DUF192 domain-containing protein [Pseudopelagicola sp.]|nr:DUF192 domain-containing protein [Pseudopelagicola sp.]
MLLACGVAVFMSALPSLAGDACRDDRVSLRGDWGEAHFRVEVADDAQERARGLMMRETLSQGAGMLFVFDETRPVSFWMKNTLIPLDMLFVDEAGVVTHLHHNAVPGDLTQIPSGGPVQFVLEINGGLARKLGISAQSEMRHPSILQSNAVWPCLP